MKIFLDTAITQEWRQIQGCAPIVGVTTNPTLVVQAGRLVSLQHYGELIAQAGQRGLADLMLQLPSANPSDALHWAQLCSEQALLFGQAAQALPLMLTFKLPCHPDWQGAHHALKHAGYATLLTGVSNSVQLLWAQALQADYVAPYISRLATAGKDVDGFLKAMVAVQNAGGPKLMAASVKTEALFSRLIALGADACTVKPAFLMGLVRDEVTDQAIAQFAKDCTFSEDNAK